MQAVTAAGVRLAYDDVGTGDDVLLLVHGHPFNRSMWAPQLEAVRAAGWRAIVPDLRGYGQSEVVPGRATLDVFAADLAGLLDHLGVRRAALGGLSMGGQIVMEFARRYRERMRGLMLAATFPRAETATGRRARLDMAERLVREGMAGYAADALSQMLSVGSIRALPAVAAHVSAMMLATNPEGAAAALRGRAERPPYDDTLAGLTVPALVVVGREDAFTTPDDAEQMRRLLRDCELVWLEGIGHMPNLEAPAEFNTALLRFLRRLGTPLQEAPDATR